MKKTLLLFLLLPFLTFAQNVDLIKWDAATPSDREKPTVINSSIASSYLTSSASPSEIKVKYTTWSESFFLCSGWPDGQQNEGEYDPEKYVEFKITPNSGKKLDINLFKLTFKSQGGASTEKFTILYTKDPQFKKDIKVLVPERTSVANWATITPSFSEEMNPVLPGQTVYIRLYVYNSNNDFHIKPGTDGATITGSVSDFDPNKILAINDYVKAIKNVALNISPLNNDIKKENVTSIVISSPPPASQGTVTINPDKTITFNPANNFTGTASFKYTIKDASNLTSEAKIQVTVGEDTPESLVIWYGRNTSNRYEPTLLSPYVSSDNIKSNGGVSLSYNNSEDSSNPFFHTGSWPSGVADNNKYVQFKITADNTHRVNLNAFNLVYRSQGGNGQRFKINYSNDSAFSSNVKTLVADASTSSNWTSISAPFSSDLNYLLPGQTIYIRLYVYNTYNAFQFRTKLNITGSIKDSNVFAAYSDFATTPTNQSISIPVLANDVVGNTPVQSITVTQPTSGGTVVVNGITDVKFTPTAGFVGMSNFTYTISNGTLYSSATVSVDVTPAPCTPIGDQVTFGQGSWIGYVYKWTGTTPPTLAYNSLPDTSVSSYIGTVTENANFDRNIGTGAITGVTTNFACEAAPADNFLVRYKMQANITEAGLYNFTIGGDDAIRLYIDGKIILTRWARGSYEINSTLYQLEIGVHDFVVEYFEYDASARASFSFGLPKGNPALFGDKVWNVYGYNKNDITLQTTAYAGYYIDPNQNANSTAYWTTGKSPYTSSNWQGAPMPDDYFTVVSKRKGFNCGQYQIQVANYDDDLQIYVDGTKVFDKSGNTDTAALVNNGQLFSLNSKTEIEIRLKENGGAAKSSVIFINVPNNNPGNANGSALVINSNTTLNSDLTVCSCTINDKFTLTVPKDITLTVDEDITVLGEGKLLIQSGGSLLQTSTSKNMFTGGANTFEIQRTTNVSRYDVTYWSSPVKGLTMHDLSPDTLWDKYHYWNTSTKSWVPDNYGKKEMEPGNGYSIRAPQTFDIETPSDFTARFKGTPNNGDVSVPVVQGIFNFLGNPYPSAVDARELINQNPNDLGALYFWTHKLPAQLIPGTTTFRYQSADFVVFTLTGSTRITGESVTNSDAFNGYIGAGQGFFTLAPTGAVAVKFNNSLRKGSSKNTQFYKTAGTKQTDANRLWLNVSNSKGTFKQLLIGYIEGATNGFDFAYDAQTAGSNANVDFYTINEGKKLTIQGRALPFDNTEIIPLGFKCGIDAVEDRDFTFSLDHADGFFDTQEVYLEDKILGKIIDLRKENYTFSSSKGTYSTRFVLRYTNKTLGTDDFENATDGLLVSVKSKVVNVTSGIENIKEIQIYTIGGQLLYSKNKIEAKELKIENLHSSNQVLLVKVILENGHIVTKKIIFN